MSTYANIEDPDEISLGSTLFVKVKTSSNKIQYFLKYNLTPLVMCNGPSQVYLSNQNEKFISVQRVNQNKTAAFVPCEINSHFCNTR